MTEIYKKNFKWEITAFNENNEELYKKIGKIATRPSLWIEEIKKNDYEWIPGKTEWNTIFIILDYNENDYVKLSQTKYIKLRLFRYVGETPCGDGPLEEWISGPGDLSHMIISDDKLELDVAFKCKDWSYKNPVEL